jgi:hypothetical protein
MYRCAFLTMEDLRGFVYDDELAVEPLRALGWEVDFVPWTSRGIDWNSYDVVLPRTTWDYHHRLTEFLDVLGQISRSRAKLANNLDLIRWNSRKSYLLDLRDRGVPIVPTITGRGLTPGSIRTLVRELGTNGIVIKPLIGANADFTHRVYSDPGDRAMEEVCAEYRERDYLAQEFLPNILTEGEYSLFYFNGEHSHTILKTPKEGDFRVQEEHGGIIRPAGAASELLTAGRKTMELLGAIPLYARGDYVRHDRSGFLLMELELIEPALYFRMDAAAPERFARALNDWNTTVVRNELHGSDVNS